MRKRYKYYLRLRLANTHYLGAIQRCFMGPRKVSGKFRYCVQCYRESVGYEGDRLGRAIQFNGKRVAAYDVRATKRGLRPVRVKSSCRQCGLEMPADGIPELRALSYLDPDDLFWS